MKHEKTFEAIAKLKDVEIELHRLKNALEMANKALDAKHEKREWVGLTGEEKAEFSSWLDWKSDDEVFEAIEARLKELNQ